VKELIEIKIDDKKNPSKVTNLIPASYNRQAWNQLTEARRGKVLKAWNTLTEQQQDEIEIRVRALHDAGDNMLTNYL